MSNSTDEDAQCVIRSRNIGVLESEVESVAKGVSSGGVSSGAESSDVDRDLVIAEEENRGSESSHGVCGSIGSCPSRFW